MSNLLYEMTPAELDILLAGVEDPNIFFDYWFRKPGQEHGWQLDANFIDEQKWQKQMCMASQNFIVAICGIATGKSLGVVMSAAYHATITPSFKFLNVAKEGWQSKLMHKALLEQAKDTPFEKLIVASPTRPYPMINIAYMVGDRRIDGTLEFMSLGESGDATNIFSYRGDWINIEEAGRIDNLNEIVGNLATRLTGVTAEGRPFLARMSLISNPWDNLELWQLYDMALADKEDGLVFNIDTAANKNVTDKQVKLALKRIPEDQHERFMTGNRQQGRGNYFAPHNVEACESEELQKTYLDIYRRREGNAIILENPVLGVWHMRMPRIKGHTYFVVGDPGTGAAPARNAPTIIVADVTNANANPIFIPIVGFWWGNGGGSIMPFIDKLLEWSDYYNAIHTYVDSTGTQKNTAELINFDMFYRNSFTAIHNMALNTPGETVSMDEGNGFAEQVPRASRNLNGLEGLGFASMAKITYLMSLRLSIEGTHIMYPKFLQKSVSSQLKNYDYVKDKNANSKLAQDIVACLSMLAFAVRKEFGYNLEDDNETNTEGDTNSRVLIRYPRATRIYGRDSRRTNTT